MTHIIVLKIKNFKPTDVFCAPNTHALISQNDSHRDLILRCDFYLRGKFQLGSEKQDRVDFRKNFCLACNVKLKKGF